VGIRVHATRSLPAAEVRRTLANWHVLRLTGWQVIEQPEPIVELLQARVL
jgi:hypothetical protein